MFLPESVRRLLPWLHLPLGLLVALLQRTPAARVLAGGPDYVLRSRAGDLLRAGFTATALGALHGRAGATTFVQSVPNPILGSVGVPIAGVAFTYTGTPSAPTSFQITGSLPPGLSFSPAPIAGTVRSGTPTITGTPTQAGSFTVFVQGFNPQGLTNNIRQPITFEITGSAAIRPTITAQPQSQTVAPGASVTFSVQATGSPAPTFQWRKNGVNIGGATASSYAIANVQAADAGTYTVVATNSAGSDTSSAATLTVTGVSGTPPAIVSQPIGVTVASGGSAALTVVASGTGTLSYQWRRGGVAIPGATNPTLLLPSVTAAAVGSYTAAVSTASGATTVTNAAAVAVSNGAGRLSNLSVRTNLGAGAVLIVGFATNGSKSVLLRGIGPTLGSFGIPGVYADPRLEVFEGQTKVTENEDWNVALAPTFAALGAFPLTPGSKDAALQTTAAGAYTAHLKGAGSGVVLVEVYDAGSGNAVRLENVSARNVVGTGDNILIAGFVVEGNVGKTLLIRAVGPTLASFGVGGTLANPKLEIFNSDGVKVVENDNWPATLAVTAASVGAFALIPNSLDAALLVTLPPDAYTAQVSGVAGGTGEALVEVYEVP